MNNLWQDLRFASRVLRKSPGFTAVAVAALALGIGANTAIFSVVNAVLLRPLPYEDSERLVVVAETSRQNPSMFVSYPNFLDWKERSRVFESLSAFRSQSFNLAGGDEPARVEGRQVSADFFQTLRVRPAPGRAFLAEEDRAGAEPVAVISHALWRRRFGGDPSVVGQAITLDDRPFQIVGVMPEGFRYGGEADVFVPFGQFADLPGWMKREVRPGARVLARLRPGVTVAAAQSEMESIAAQLEAQHPATNTGVGVRVTSMHEAVVGDTRTPLLVLLGAVGFVLLIACANVANLLLARAASRQKEFAIRLALGASRLRLVRQLLAESVLLSLAGGAAGLLLAWWGVDLLLAAGGAGVPRSSEVGVDARVLLFTLLLSFLTGLLFGLAPALHSSGARVNDALKEGGKSSSAAVGGRFRDLLVVSEIALALVLLVGAGLLIQSFVRLQRVDPGFDPSNVLTMRVPLPRNRYAENEQVARFYAQLLERVRQLPGVEAAAVSNELPLASRGWLISVEATDRPIPPPGEELTGDWAIVSPDYFRAMGVQLLRGRPFDERDAAGSPRVVVIDEEMARHFWPEGEALGKRLYVVGGEPFEVVGVARRVRSYGLDSDSRKRVYTSAAQTPMHAMNLVVRTGGPNPAALTASVAAEVRALDRDQPIYEVRTMERIVAASVAPQRFNTLLLGVFASVALLLAVVGIYGVISYFVTLRTHEIGVRMALGAQPRDVLRLVVRRGMLMTLAGVGAGLLASLALTRVMSSLLFGVSATDPLTFAAVALLLAAVALAASLIPARRATKVDPLVALRYE